MLELGSAERHTFSAKFVRKGYKSGFRGDITTYLFSDVMCDGELLTDHIWITETKGLKSLDLVENNIVQFNARVSLYTKGYQGRREDVPRRCETDCKLSYPNNFKIIAESPSN